MAFRTLRKFEIKKSDDNDDDDNHNTPWSRVLLEKLTGSELVKTFNIFYGTDVPILHSAVPATCPYPYYYYYYYYYYYLTLLCVSILLCYYQ
jgi:hypothetical protein